MMRRVSLTGERVFALENKPHFQVAAGLIPKDGTILIARRPAGTHLAGLWEFPGGKKEEGETLLECLEREIREELGITVKAERLLCMVEHEYESKSISLHLFQCSSPNEDPSPLGCDALEWVRPEELDRYPMPPADKEFILLVKGLKEEK
jgi:mutator protein MutT